MIAAAPAFMSFQNRDPAGLLRPASFPSDVFVMPYLPIL